MLLSELVACFRMKLQSILDKLKPVHITKSLDDILQEVNIKSLIFVIFLQVYKQSFKDT